MGEKGIFSQSGYLPSPRTPRSPRGSLPLPSPSPRTVQRTSGGDGQSPLFLPEVAVGGRRFSRRGGVPVLPLHDLEKERGESHTHVQGFNYLMDVLKELIDNDESDTSLDEKFGAIGEHLYMYSTMKKYRQAAEELLQTNTNEIQGACKLLDSVMQLFSVTYPKLTNTADSAWNTIKGFVFSTGSGNIRYDTAVLHSEESFRKQLLLNKVPLALVSMQQRTARDTLRMHFKAWRGIPYDKRQQKIIQAKKQKWEKEIISEKNAAENRLVVANTRLETSSKRLTEEIVLNERQLARQKEDLASLEEEVAGLYKTNKDLRAALETSKHEVSTMDEYYDSERNDLKRDQESYKSFLSGCLMMVDQEQRRHEIALRDELMSFIRPFLAFEWEESLHTLPKIAGRWINTCTVPLRDRVQLIDANTIFMKVGNEVAELHAMHAVLHHVAPRIIPAGDFTEFSFLASAQAKAEHLMASAQRMGLSSSSMIASELATSPCARLHFIVGVMHRIIDCWSHWAAGDPVFTAPPVVRHTLSPKQPEDRRRSAAACPSRPTDKMLSGVVQKPRSHTAVTILLPDEGKLPSKELPEKPTSVDDWREAVVQFQGLKAELGTASHTLSKTLLVWTLRRSALLAHRERALGDLGEWRFREVDVATLLGVPLEESPDPTEALNDIVLHHVDRLQQVYHYYYGEGEGRVDMKAVVKDLGLTVGKKDHVNCVDPGVFLKFMLKIVVREGEGVVQGFEVFVRNMVNTLCWRCDVASFRLNVCTAKVAEVMEEHRHGLQKVYQQHSDGRHLTFAAFKRLFTETLKVVDGRLTHHLLGTVYHKMLPVGTNANLLPTRTAKIDYGEFCFLICSVATVKCPNPFVPPEVRVRKFIEQTLAPVFPTLRRPSMVGS